MRKITLLLFIVLFLGLGFFMWKNSSGGSASLLSPLSQQSEKITEEKTEQNDYVFIPYWTLTPEIKDAPFKNLIYFGVSATSIGIDREEDGYKKLSEFVDNTNGHETYLTVRLLNSDTNIKILNSASSQKKIISEALDIAAENKFKGVVLDLELSALPFESLINKITALNQEFGKEAHKHGLSYGTLLYGDTYYRIRPFNVEEIAKNSDIVFMMSYDFSKSRGSSGPGFPLEGDTYGYNFKTMIKDFKKDVPSEKLVGVVGMFGYDWMVDENNKSKAQGVAKTTLQFEKFLTLCVSQNTCVQENTSSGMKITYKDDENEKHIVWYETNDSARKKIELMSQENINSVAFWAYGFN